MKIKLTKDMKIVLLQALKSGYIDTDDFDGIIGDLSFLNLLMSTGIEDKE